MKCYALFLPFAALTIASCSQQPPAVYTYYGVGKGAGSVGAHTILDGDTVYTIAKNYQLPMRDIITLNHLQAPYVLNTGYRLVLPSPNEHTVKQGDTVESIAKMYETSPSALVRLNNLSSPYRLVAQQIIRLPALESPSMAGSTQNVALTTTPDMQQTVANAKIETVEKQTTFNDGFSSPQSQSAQPTQVAVTQQVPPQPQANTPSAVQTTSVTKSLPMDDVPKMTGNGRFMRPVDGRIISAYGPKEGGLYNDGINISAVRGTPVRAAENGIVAYVGDDLEGYGNLVLVRHEGKMMSAYAHLDKTLVKRGAKVVRGQSIGTVGSTGQVDAPQLHFEIREGSKPLDPAKYL